MALPCTFSLGLRTPGLLCFLFSLTGKSLISVIIIICFFLGGGGGEGEEGVVAF